MVALIVRGGALAESRERVVVGVGHIGFHVFRDEPPALGSVLVRCIEYPLVPSPLYLPLHSRLYQWLDAPKHTPSSQVLERFRGVYCVRHIQQILIMTAVIRQSTTSIKPTTRYIHCIPSNRIRPTTSCVPPTENPFPKPVIRQTRTCQSRPCEQFPEIISPKVDHVPRRELREVRISRAHSSDQCEALNNELHQRAFAAGWIHVPGHDDTHAG